jgi:hypothetical protein
VQRSIVYQRAKNALDKRPFGTQLDVYGAAVRVDQPLDAADARSSRTTSASDIGGPVRKPYSASVFNISAMSFGALSANAIGAERGREARRLLPRHRRRLDLAYHRDRRRPGLGNRLGLLRLPQRRRQFQRALSARTPRPTR